MKASNDSFLCIVPKLRKQVPEVFTEHDLARDEHSTAWSPLGALDGAHMLACQLEQVSELFLRQAPCSPDTSQLTIELVSHRQKNYSQLAARALHHCRARDPGRVGCTMSTHSC